MLSSVVVSGLVAEHQKVPAGPQRAFIHEDALITRALSGLNRLAGTSMEWLPILEETFCIVGDALIKDHDLMSL